MPLHECAASISVTDGILGLIDEESRSRHGGGSLRSQIARVLLVAGKTESAWFCEVVDGERSVFDLILL